MRPDGEMLRLIAEYDIVMGRGKCEDGLRIDLQRKNTWKRSTSSGGASSMSPKDWRVAS